MDDEGQGKDDRERGVRVPDRQWTTCGARGAEQFGLWQDAVDAAFVPVTVRRAAPGQFVSDVAVYRLGGVELADIAAPPQSVTRTPAQIGGSPADAFFLNLPLTDDASVRQAGRTARLSRGDFVVVDGDRPFDLAFASRFRQVSLTLPRELLDARLAATDDVIGTRVAGDHGLGAVASAAIRATAASGTALDRRAGRELGERLVDLVALALGGVRPQHGRVPAARLLRAARDEAERRLGDPQLSPAVVAERVGISTRYLHRLFSEDGASFRRWLLARRLELAGLDLADPERRDRGIGQLARARGFDDPSYFARVFRACYDMTPREFRALHADARSSAPTS